MWRPTGVAGGDGESASVELSPGRERADKAHESWAPDLDFFLQQSSFTKLMEGKYDDRERKMEPTGFDALLAGARAVLAERN